jgi:hypothetical protein
LLNVNAAISAMSVPVGPHGSLEVAGQCQWSKMIQSWRQPTISHLDLNTAIALGNVLDTSDDFRHTAAFPGDGRSLE